MALLSDDTADGYISERYQSQQSLLTQARNGYSKFVYLANAPGNDNTCARFLFQKRRVARKPNVTNRNARRVNQLVASPGDKLDVANQLMAARKVGLISLMAQMICGY